MTLPDSRRPVGRPRGFDADLVADQTMATFWDRGVAETTIAELAAATGLSTSSLYHHFGSREGAAIVALDRYLETVIDGLLVGPMHHGGAGVQDVLAYLDRIEHTDEACPGRGCLAVNTMASRDVSPAVAARAAAFRERLSAGLTAALRRAERRGEIPAGAADQRVEPLLGMIFAVCLLASAGAHAESRRMLDAARALVSAGC